MCEREVEESQQMAPHVYKGPHTVTDNEYLIDLRTNGLCVDVSAIV